MSATMYPFPHYYRYTVALRPLLGIEYFPVLRRRLKGTVATIYRARAVLLLLLFHIIFFTTLGLQMFHGTPEGAAHFATFLDSMVSLIVLLTTCNSPSIMMPAFAKNRLYAIYFISFIVIGLFLLLNLVLAIVYREHKENVVVELKSASTRRYNAMRKAFVALSHNGTAASKLTAMLRAAGYADATAQSAAETLMAHDDLTFARFKKCIDVADATAERARQEEYAAIEEAHRGTLAQRLVYHRTRLFVPCIGRVRFNTLDFIINTVLVISLLVAVTMLCRDVHAYIDHEPWQIKLFNGSMSILFVFEVWARICASGPRAYFRSAWNCFEFTIVIVSALGVCLSALPAEKKVSRMFSFVRQARVLRLLRSVGVFRSLTETIGALLPSLQSFLMSPSILLLFRNRWGWHIWRH